MDVNPLADCVLLLVDDEEANLDLLEECLLPDGYAKLLRASDSREAVPLFEATNPDLVLLDLHMPHLSGFEVMRQLQRRVQPGDYRPVLVLTADALPHTRARALSDGAHDFLTKPLDALEVRLRVRNLLNTRRLHLGQRAAREAAEAAIRAREQVLAFVAHDLRNPLASIAMDAEMARNLIAAEARPAEHRSLLRIERNAQRMHGLIEDLLEIVRLESGSFAIRPEPVSPLAVFAEAAAMLRPLAERRGVELAFALPAEAPAVKLDESRILQLLSNLVGNALRFTPAGGVVRVVLEVGGDELVASVTDTGEGIPAERLPHVFAAFWQRNGERGAEGLGIGLVISRAIVEAHGGRIWIESTPGVGTRVRFTLPLTAGSSLAA